MNFQKKSLFLKKSRLKVTYTFMALTNSLVVLLKVTYTFMALTNSLVVLFIAVLLQIF